MNKLVSGEDGFLESPGSLSRAFDVDKKRKLIEFALDYVEKNQKAPSMASLADAVGIGIRTLEKHLNRDEEFKDRFREVLWRADAILDDAMFKRAKEPGGFMDRMAWKRRFFPELWAPERQGASDGPQVVINISLEKLKESRRRIEAMDADIAKEFAQEAEVIHSSGHPDE